MKIKTVLFSAAFGLVVAVILYAASQTFLYWPLLKTQNRIDDRHFAQRYKLNGAPAAEQDGIIIVDIDDRSMRSLGSVMSKRWPRRHMADVIEYLAGDGAKLIYLDILFENWTRDNEILAESVASAGNVIAGYYFDLEYESRKRRPDDSIFNEAITENIIDGIAPEGSRFIQSRHVVLPYSRLVWNVKALGFANYIPDPDGVLRHIPLYISSGRNGSMVSASAAMQMWLYLKDIHYSDASLKRDGVEFNGLRIPTDRHCFMRLNYHTAGSVYPYVSFVDVLNGDFEEGAFADKIVMIGSGSEKAGDLKVIPGDQRMPGVEVHATALSTLLNGKFIEVVSGNIILSICIVSGITGGLLFSLLPLKFGLMITLLYTLSMFALSRLLFIKSGMLLNIVIPSFIILLLFAVIAAHELFERFEIHHGALTPDSE